MASDEERVVPTIVNAAAKDAVKALLPSVANSSGQMMTHRNNRDMNLNVDSTNVDAEKRACRLFVDEKEVVEGTTGMKGL